MAGTNQPLGATANIYGFQFESHAEERPNQSAAMPGASGRVAGTTPAPSIPPAAAGGAAATAPGRPPTSEEILQLRRDPRATQQRPDLDKLFDVLKYLSEVPDHRPVDALELLKKVQVDLRPNVGADLSVHQLLIEHPKVITSSTPGVYQYQAKFRIGNRVQLLNFLDRYKQRLPHSEVCDSYDCVEDDLEDMVRGGELIAVRDDNQLIYFTRGKPFLTALSGRVEGSVGEARAHTSEDLRREIRRGEAVRVAEEWFRVSTAEDRKVQRKAGGPPPSVTIGAGRERWPPQDLREDAEVIYNFRDPFNLEWGLPLSDDVEQDPPRRAMPAVRHGCTTDVRELLWAPTGAHVPEDDVDLLARLREADLAAHESGPRRPKMSKAQEKSAKQKRKRKDKEAAWREDVRVKAQEIKDRQMAAAKARKTG